MVKGVYVSWLKEAAASGSAQRMQVPSATELPIFQEVRNLDVYSQSPFLNVEN